MALLFVCGPRSEYVRNIDGKRNNLDNTRIIFLDLFDFYENAFPISNNYYKYFGTIAKYISLGYCVLVPGPNNYIDNRGKNFLLKSVNKRLKKPVRHIGCIEFNDTYKVHQSYYMYLINNVYDFYRSSITNFNSYHNNHYNNNNNNYEKYVAGFTITVPTLNTISHVTTGHKINLTQERQSEKFINNIIRKFSATVFNGEIINVMITFTIISKQRRDNIKTKNYHGSIIYLPELGNILYPQNKNKNENDQEFITIDKPYASLCTKIKATSIRKIIMNYLDGIDCFEIPRSDISGKKNVNDDFYYLITLTKGGSIEIKMKNYFSFLLE